MEIFKKLMIEDYGFIQVGNKGTIIGKKGVMKPSNQNSKKYYRVHIGKHMYSVHRLVAQAFLDNPFQLPQVNHKDGNKSNNCVENLEWCTNKMNKEHAVKTSLISSKINKQIADEIRKKYSIGTYTYCDLAEMYDLSFSMIGYIVREDSWNLEDDKYELS